MLIANIIYFIWMPYPKSFLKATGSSMFVFNLITNLIFFSLFAVILLVSVKSVARPGQWLERKKIPASIALCIAIQLGFDFVKLISELLLHWYEPLSNDFFTVLELLVLALVTIKLLKVNNVNWKRFYTIFLPFAVIALIVFFAMDIQSINNVRHAADKYVFSLFDTDLTHEANAIITNTEFIYEIRNAVLDFLTCAAIMIALYFSAVSKNIEDDEKYHTKKAHFVTRVAAVIMLSLFICGLKMIAIPHNSMKETHMPQTHSVTTLPAFDYNRTQVIHSRATGYDGTLKPVYNATHSYILYNNEIILEFDTAGKYIFDIENSFGNEYSSDIYQNADNVYFLYSGFETIDVDNSEVKICLGDKAIAYLKDSKPYAIKVCDVSDEEFDSVLLAACEKLIEESRMSSFEYIAEYILKYDPDFIMPYIERYSAGEFTAEELEKNPEIQTEYITKCAKQLNN